MATIAELLARLNRHVRPPSEDALASVDRKAFVLQALRRQSHDVPRFVIEDVTPAAPVAEFDLPSDFTRSDNVQWIENPVDQPRQRLLEPEEQWRTAHTATGSKVIFLSSIDTPFRIAYTLPWVEADLAEMNERDADAVGFLSAHYAAGSVGSYYAQMVRGLRGSPADLAGASDLAREWTGKAEGFLESWREITGIEPDNPGGPAIRTSTAAVRRLGYPSRFRMPRGQQR